MSRTDKDMPYWVRAEWWEPVHFCKHGMYSRYRIRRTDECDLPSEPIVKEFHKSWRRKDMLTTCFWEPQWSHSTRIYRAFGKVGVPKWYVDHVWWNPQRRSERDILRDAKKDWNANKDTDIEVWAFPARNSAKWYYW